MTSHGLFHDYTNAMRENDDLIAELEDRGMVIYTLLGIIFILAATVFMVVA